jgi:hypothetical protein
MTGTGLSRLAARQERVKEAARKNRISYAFGRVKPETIELIQSLRRGRGMSMDGFLYCLARKEQNRATR